MPLVEISRLQDCRRSRFCQSQHPPLLGFPLSYFLSHFRPISAHDFPAEGKITSAAFGVKGQGIYLIGAHLFFLLWCFWAKQAKTTTIRVILFFGFFDFRNYIIPLVVFLGHFGENHHNRFDDFLGFSIIPGENVEIHFSSCGGFCGKRPKPPQEPEAIFFDFFRRSVPRCYKNGWVKGVAKPPSPLSPSSFFPSLLLPPYPPYPPILIFSSPFIPLPPPRLCVR